jgi:hypothetical protein
MPSFPRSAPVMMAGLFIFTILIFVVQYRLYRPRALRSPAFLGFTRSLIILIMSLFWVFAVFIAALESMPH